MYADIAAFGYKIHKQSLLAIIVVSLCHLTKYFHLKFANLRCRRNFENEILSKLLKNGCVCVCGGGGGGASNPLNWPYGYVPPYRVWLSGNIGVEKGTHFA